MIDINFDLNLLKVFICVYEQQSINKASQKLYISQPAVSYSINKLEKYLNCKLFKRVSKGCIPLPQADVFYNSCKSCLFKLEQGILCCNKDNLKSMTLNIGANPSIIKLFLPQIKTFNKIYPNVKITFTEVITKRLERYLERGDIDIAIIEDTKQTNNNLKKIEIAPLDYCFVANKNEKNSKITKQSINNVHLALCKKDTSIREFFDDLCNQNKVSVTPFYEMASPISVIEFVKQNLCVGFIPKQYANDDVKILGCDFEIKKSSFVVIKRKEEDLYLVDEFVKMLKK